MQKRLLPVALLTFINTLGFSLLIPVLPFIVKQYGANEITYGLLLSSYFVFQFLGSPVLGALSDKYGRKPLLIVSQFGTLVGWIIFAVAWFLPNIPFAFTSLPIAVIALARIVDGLTGGNISVANAYLSDITEPAERTKVFGSMGAILGVGMIIGPALGSFSNATKIGYLGTILVAIAISLLTLIFMVRYLKESLPEEDRNKEVDLHLGRQLNVIKKIRKYKDRQLVMSILQMRVFFALMMSGYTSIIVFHIVEQFGLSEKQLGFFMLVVGIFLIFNQGVLVKRFVQRFKDSGTLLIGHLSLITGLAILDTTRTLWLFVVFYYLINLGLSLSMPALKGLITHSISRSEQGEIMGIDESLSALASSVAPTLAGILYYHIHGLAFGVFGILLIFSLGLMWIRTGKVTA